MTINLIQHGTKAYEQMIDLRMRILRKPLGLSFTEDDLLKEANDILIGTFEKEKLIGCCVLTDKSNSTLQLRQMAVEPAMQDQGIGSSLIRFAEALAKEKGYTTLIMHARKIAVGFYQKCGYTIAGNEFTEVGIPHFKMEKKL